VPSNTNIFFPSTRVMRNQKVRKRVKMYLTRIFTVVFLEFGRGTLKTKILFEKWVRFFRLSKLSNFFNRKFLKRSVSLLKKSKQILAQQPCGVRAFLFGILDKFASFPKLFCHTNVFSRRFLRFFKET
jgi:hypothetical protein